MITEVCHYPPVKLLGIEYNKFRGTPKGPGKINQLAQALKMELRGKNQSMSIYETVLVSNTKVDPHMLSAQKESTNKKHRAALNLSFVIF